MTSREIFDTQLNFRLTGRKFFHPHLIHPDTLDRWHREGLPGDVTGANVKAFFGFDRKEGVPVDNYLLPRGFTISEKSEDWEIRVWDLGFIEKIPREGHMGMSQWLKYGLETRADWPKFKACLNPETPGRFPANWERLVQGYAQRDYPLGVHAGSIYGVTRNWMGVEGISCMYYDDPAFMHEIAEYLTEFYLALHDRVTRAIPDLDFACFFEDMAYKTGPLVSPAMFREFMLPYYRRIVEFLRNRGVKRIWIDSDGNLDDLLPVFREAGVDGVLPMEIAAGSLPEKYRAEYPDLLMIGGVDKRALSRTKDLIDREIERIRPVVERGGYIPMVDHYMPPDISFDNACYYFEKLKGLLHVND